MKKILLFIMSFAACFLLTTSCSEDDITVDDSLSNTVFDKELPTNTELDRAIKEVYDRFATLVSYKDFTIAELGLNWGNDYTAYNMSFEPCQEGSEGIALTIVNKIFEAFKVYPDVLVANYFPKRVYLVKKVFKSTSSYAYVDLPVHGIAIGDVDASVNWTDSKLTTLKTNLENSMLNNIYDNNAMALTDFVAERGYHEQYFTIRAATDPYGDFVDQLGERSTTRYSAYLLGVAGYNPKNEYLGVANGPTDQADLGYFLQFLFTKPKAELDFLFYTRTDFTVLKKRAYLLSEFIRNEMKLNPEEIQSKSCPTDPVPSGYFSSLGD